MKKAKDYYKYEVVNEWCVPEYFETLYEARMFARGQGQPVRYVPVYMVSNHVSSLNPYYKEWGCSCKWLERESYYKEADK